MKKHLELKMKLESLGIKINNINLLMEEIFNQVNILANQFRETEKDDPSLEAFEIQCNENFSRHGIPLISMDNVNPEDAGIDYGDLGFDHGGFLVEQAIQEILAQKLIKDLFMVEIRFQKLKNDPACGLMIAFTEDNNHLFCEEATDIAEAIEKIAPDQLPEDQILPEKIMLPREQIKKLQQLLRGFDRTFPLNQNL